MTHTIRQLLDQVYAGNIRIPAFQRSFVWDPERVAMFMDSIYKGYPFGSLLFWRTRTKLKHERKLGPYQLPERDPEYPLHYVLDGQQRLTSIFAVFQTEMKRPDDPDWLDVYFDLLAQDDVQESQFVALPDNDVVEGQHFPLSCLFDSVSYRRATSGLPDDDVVVLDKLQDRFKETSVPIQLLETENRAQVAIVFERVNRLGMELDTLQLLTAWTWSEDFDLQNKFEDLGESLEDYGFGEVGLDADLILRCCAAVITGDPSAESLVNLNGADVRDQFSRVESGLRGAIDFLRSEFQVHRLKNLPFPTLLIPMSVFFAEPEGKQVKHSDTVLGRLRQWFWRCCFARRYSGQPYRAARSDIEQIAKLKDGKANTLGEFGHEIDGAFFLESQFRMAAVNTKTFILLLAQRHPRSFVSGNAVSLGETLQRYNRNEFHHLYPRKYLRDLGKNDSEINVLANFCFLSRTDNNQISGRAPSLYKSLMPSNATRLSEILESAMCSSSLFHDDYDLFKRERAAALLAQARALMG